MICSAIIASGLEVFACAALMLVLVGGLLGLNHLVFHHGARKKKATAAKGSHEQRLKKPKFDELEKHFGRTFPQDLKALYDNSEEIRRENFQVAARSADGSETVWNIAFYQPADLEGVREAFPKTNEVFEFANDGSGNGYTIDPALDNPPVMFYDHETAKWDKVADNFSTFIAMPRR
jgi:hypothetical protein